MRWSWTATYAGSEDPAPTLDLSEATSNELEITSAMIGFKLKATATANASGYTGSASKETSAVVASQTVTITGVTGGEVTMSGTTAGVGTTVTLTVDPDAGYQLKALSVAPTAGGEALDLTPEVESTVLSYTFTMPAEEVTVTPEFEAKKYTIKFDKNNAYASGTMADLENQVITSSAKLTTIGYTVANHVFAGWATSTSDEVVYADQAAIAKVIEDNEANTTITLYAVWNSYEEAAAPIIAQIKALPTAAQIGQYTTTDQTTAAGEAITDAANAYTNADSNVKGVVDADENIKTLIGDSVNVTTYLSGLADTNSAKAEEIETKEAVTALAKKITDLTASKDLTGDETAEALGTLKDEVTAAQTAYNNASAAVKEGVLADDGVKAVYGDTQADAENNKDEIDVYLAAELDAYATAITNAS